MIRSKMTFVVSALLDIAADKSLDVEERIAASKCAWYWMDGVRVLDSGDPSFSLKWRSIIGKWSCSEVSGDIYGFVANNPVMSVDILGLLSLEQCSALRQILELEERFGTSETSNRISNTWGESNLLQPFNADDGNSSQVNGVDIDWFADLSSFSVARLPFFTTALYTAAKSAWAIWRKTQNDPLGNPIPFTDPGERAAVLKVELWRHFKDIITPEYLARECPDKCAGK